MYLKVLRDIRKTASRNHSMRILQTCGMDDTLRSILYYAYHPLMHYHIRQIPWRGKGQETLANLIWRPMLDSLADQSLSGQKAKTTVQTYIESLTKADAELFKQILKKDLRAGISIKTINASDCGVTIPTFGVMLAKTYSSDIDKPMYMSLKFDGLRAVYTGHNLYTRNGHVILGMDHILAELKSLECNSFDGELLIPGLHFQESSGLIRSHKACPKAQYFIFDKPSSPEPFTYRYNQLALDLKGHTDGSLNLVKHVRTASVEVIDRTYNKALDAGYEGLVLKDPYHEYQCKRSSDWLKLKAVQSIDLPIVDVFRGTGKYEDSLGGIIVRNTCNLIRVGSGFTDVLRDEIWRYPAQVIGKTAEILYHEETPDGSLRHPRLSKIHMDR